MVEVDPADGSVAATTPVGDDLEDGTILGTDGGPAASYPSGVGNPFVLTGWDG